MRRLAKVTSRWVQSRPMLRRFGRRLWLHAPDFRTTIQVEGIGPLRIRFARHRIFLYRDFLKLHAKPLAQFRHLIAPGDCVYDVGANIGYYARYIVSHCQPSRVVAFEPASENLELLRANIALGRCEDRVQIMPIGLGDVDAEEKLQIDDVFGGTGRLDRLAAGEASMARQVHGLPPKTESIAIRRLDAVVDSGAPPPQFMKIDVEGAEALVFAGGTRTLAEHAPKLAIALHGAEVGERVLTLLSDADYLCYGWTKPAAAGDKPVYGRIRPGDMERLAESNIVASRSEADLTGLA